MRRVYITKLMSADLKSRSTVQTLCALLKDYEARDTVIDFTGVHFATRSFMDEFYNVVVLNQGYSFENMPEDIVRIYNTVKHTQNKEKGIVSTDDVKFFSSVDDFRRYLSALSF